MKIENWNLKIAAALLSAVFIFIRGAAASPLPVAVSPTRIEITANPGDRVDSSFSFWNGTDADLPLHLEAVDVIQQDEEGHAAVEPEAAANSMKSWLKPEYPDLNVAPKEQITLPFSVDVPADADPGTHWGALVAITAPAAELNGTAVNVRTGVIILIRVLGDAKENLTLESFSGPKYIQEPPLEFAARFKNEGTVHEAPQGSIEVRNMLGELVATGTLPERNVLPGTVRKMTASLGGGVWIGKYTATLHATYGDQNEALPEATATFWVLPWKRYGPWALGIVLFVSLILWRRKRLPAVWHVLRTGELLPTN